MTFGYTCAQSEKRESLVKVMTKFVAQHGAPESRSELRSECVPNTL